MTDSPHRSAAPYADPVGKLLEIGEPPPVPDRKAIPETNWLDYRARYGLGPEHVGELTRMACDPALNNSGVHSTDMWGPLHAWRALGQMRAMDATAPLLALAQALEFDDFVSEELPVVFGMIGEAAIRPIADMLLGPNTSFPAGGTAVAGLTQIAQRHPELRRKCLAVIERLLLRRDRVEVEINASAVCAILDLKAVEAIEAVRDAFGREAVDLSFAGDVEDVEIRLGLRRRRDTPRPRLRGPHVETFEKMRSLMHEAEPRKPKKIGRNDPCPCGSGRKFKKCCGSSTNDGPAPM